jgi:hypothetical protein
LDRAELYPDIIDSLFYPGIITPMNTIESEPRAQTQLQWIAFSGPRRLAAGSSDEVARGVKAAVEAEPQLDVLILDARSSRMVELDLRGSLATVLRRLPEDTAPPTAVTEEAERGPGRPKLGVIPREVTLLPRHWDWLATQPGGASVALRKLVEHALRANKEIDRLREAKESAYRFMQAVAGDERGFEDATRALFANDTEAFRKRVRSWPPDVRAHALALAEVAMG